MIDAQILIIAPTKNMPGISLNPNGIINIKGCSMNENVSDFPKQVEDWIEEYICDPADLTCIDINLEYLNTSNLRFYLSLLKKIEYVILKNKKYIINWYYEEGDEDIFEKGEYFASFLNIPFNLIMISKHNDI